MSKLMHTPYRIGNIVISNRIVKSAMFEYCANQGRITDQHRQIYEDAARGGCGLIITLVWKRFLRLPVTAQE